MSVSVGVNMGKQCAATEQCHCAEDKDQEVMDDLKGMETTDDEDDVFLNNMAMEMNMPLDSKLSKPLLVKKEFTRLTLRPVLSAKLVVNKRGFLPGDNLSFTLTFKNCTKNIVKLATALIQKIKYINKDGETTKATTAVLVQKKLNSTHPNFVLKDGKIVWSSNFTIPTFIMPSLSRESKKSVEIVYSVQYALETEGKPWAGVVSGEAPIVIGTTRKGFSLIPEAHSFDPKRGSLGSSSSMQSVETVADPTNPFSTKPRDTQTKFRRISLMLIPEKEETESTYGILRLKINDSRKAVNKRTRTFSDHNTLDLE